MLAHMRYNGAEQKYSGYPNWYLHQGQLQSFNHSTGKNLCRDEKHRKEILNRNAIILLSDEKFEMRPNNRLKIFVRRCSRSKYDYKARVTIIGRKTMLKAQQDSAADNIMEVIGKMP